MTKYFYCLNCYNYCDIIKYILNVVPTIRCRSLCVRKNNNYISILHSDILIKSRTNSPGNKLSIWLKSAVSNVQKSTLNFTCIMNLFKLKFKSVFGKYPAILNLILVLQASSKLDQKYFPRFGQIRKTLKRLPLQA